MTFKNKLLVLFKMTFLKKFTSKGMFLDSKKAKNNALDIIEEHGLKAHYYLPGIGRRNDEELSNALDLLSGSGFIITDSKGNIVGRLAKTRFSSQEKAEIRRSSFKLVKSK